VHIRGKEKFLPGAGLERKKSGFVGTSCLEGMSTLPERRRGTTDLPEDGDFRQRATRRVSSLRQQGPTRRGGNLATGKRVKAHYALTRKGTRKNQEFVC